MPLGAHKAAMMGTAGVSTGDVVLLSSQTFTDQTTVQITSGITSTYGEYIFKFYNINPATDAAVFQFQVNATDDAGGGYDTSLITSTFFRAFHYENDSNAGLDYSTSNDLAQSASFHKLVEQINNDADKSCAGELHLFNPSSTTYVKQFYSRTNSTHTINVCLTHHTAGYINDTTAIDQIQFKMSSGNFDGTIKMWGVK